MVGQVGGYQNFMAGFMSAKHFGVLVGTYRAHPAQAIEAHSPL